MRGADGIQRFIAEHAFRQVAARAGLQGAIDVFIAIKGRAHYHACSGKLYPDFRHRFRTAQLGRRQSIKVTSG